MKQLFFFFTYLAFPFWVYSQNAPSGDYKRYLKLSYSEIDSLVMIPYEKGDYNTCLLLMQAGREKAQNEFGELDSFFAAYTNNIGFFYQETGQYEKALPYYIQSKNIKEKIMGVDHPDFAQALHNIVDLYMSMGNYQLALPFAIQSKNIREKVLGVEHPDFAKSIFRLAKLHQKMGNYELALPLFVQCTKIYEKITGQQHIDYAGALFGLAELYQTMGNFKLALPLYIQHKNIIEKTAGIEHPDFALSLHNLASLHQMMGNYEMALPLYIQSKDIIEKALGPQHPSFALSLNNLATLYEAMGNYDEALPLSIQCKDIKEKILGTAHPSFATSLSNLAVLYQSKGDYALALPLFIQCKNIREKALGVEHPDFAKALDNLGFLHQKMGDYELALPIFLECKNIQEKSLGSEHPYFAKALNNLADVYEKMNNRQEAWNAIYQALNSMSNLPINHTFSAGWSDSLSTADYYSNLHIEMMVRSLKIAYQLLKKDSNVANTKDKQLNVTNLSIALLEKGRNQSSNENDKLRWLEQSNIWLQKSLNVLNPQEHTSKAFNLSDQNKSVLLLQATKSETAYRLGELPDSLISQDKKLLKKQSQLEAKLLEKRSNNEKDSLRNELNHVNLDIGDFIEMIKKNYPKYYKLKYQHVDAKVEDIQALLDDNTTLLEYVIGDSVVHIFRVDKKQVLWKKSFVGNAELSKNIKTLHQSLSDYKLVIQDKENAYRNYVENAHWFYQKLVAPVLLGAGKDKQKIKNLILVTDGELGHLPFETFLVNPAPQVVTDYHQLHYLVNDYTISYNYSATLWKENKEAPAPKNNGQILAMAANYELKLDSSMTEFRLPTDVRLRNALKPLPAAQEEVEILQKRYQGFFAFDALASEKTAREKVSNFAILHFATHGILDAKRPMLSSLAFSEDNDSIESNFWQAHEISKLELNANLVVLSACETGYGRFEKGNGIASLARAFMYAGAASLIVSLWQVNDHATSEIMKNLYQNLADGMPKDEALRQAKIQYIKEAEGVLAHPAFWSSFILMGNTDAIELKQKGGWLWWGIGIGVVVLMGGVLRWIKRKKSYFMSV